VTGCHTGVTGCHAQGDRLLHDPNNTPNTSPESNPNMCDSVISETQNKESRFAEFWDMYDKKKDPKGCKKKFDGLSKKTQELIFESLPAYIASTPDKQYRKLPKSWLNQSSWLDEVDSVAVTADCGIDFELLVSDFNHAFADTLVPDAIKVTVSQQKQLAPVALELDMNNNRFKGYFNHVATSGQFNYFIDGLKIPPLGITYWLKEETIIKAMN
jgi:hypothetical protein